MSDEERLAGYVATWQSSIDSVVTLLRSLDAADWAAPTDLPGWDVHAVACHLAHLESELAGRDQQEVAVAEAPHLRSPMAYYTEQGPLARRGWEPAAVIAELEEACRARARELETDPPTDGAGTPPRTPGGIGWTWETLLSNRPLDVAMHEQDIRRAVGRPGGLDSPGVAHCVQVLGRSLPFVVGKRVAPPTGTTVRLVVAGPAGFDATVQVGDDGRAAVVDGAGEPTVSLTLDTEAFLVLAGGRRAPDQVSVAITGDEQLGAAVLAHLGVTP